MNNVPPLKMGRDAALAEAVNNLARLHRDELEMALAARRIACMRFCNDRAKLDAVMFEVDLIRQAIRRQKNA